jgi:hypothetical protein
MPTVPIPNVAANGTSANPGRADESPVFILTASRSGSTLLRFILDSHPDLACPPETSIASVCAGLARTWDILESAGSGTGRPVHDPAPLPPHAALAVREAIDGVYGHYLRRRGKRRWCDKSLDSFQFADLITQVYPQAKFICLYRHCMDVIASGVEACPWGLHRFGFDPFVAQFPGNSVAAIGSYWLNVSGTILAFEEKQPDACHRVRYEDMVTAPEESAAGIFSFLGVGQVPGITEACFQTPHEGEGPGDEKIWFTAGVAPDSTGRGVSVPVAALAPQTIDAINETLGRLDYRPVDERWNATPGRMDPRADVPATTAANGATGHEEDRAELTAAVAALSQKLVPGDPLRLRDISERWPTVAGATVAIIVQSPQGRHEELRLRFDGAAREGGEADPVARVMASSATWQSLLSGSANLVTEMTSGRLRCVNKRDDHRIRSDEVHALATLLGIATIPMARTPAIASTA